MLISDQWNFLFQKSFADLSILKDDIHSKSL